LTFKTASTADGNCEYQLPVKGYDGIPLHSCSTWGEREGYKISYFDFHEDSQAGAKYRMADRISEKISNSPSDLPLIIGHSAGADASLLSLETMNEQDRFHITGEILLDPTQTVGTDGERQDFRDPQDLSDILKHYANSGIPIFVGDGYGGPISDESLRQYLGDYIGYQGYPGVGHLELTTNIDALYTSLNYIFSSW
jgi:hypothetical protein